MIFDHGWTEFHSASSLPITSQNCCWMMIDKCCFYLGYYINRTETKVKTPSKIIDHGNLFRFSDTNLEQILTTNEFRSVQRHPRVWVEPTVSNRSSQLTDSSSHFSMCGSVNAQKHLVHSFVPSLLPVENCLSMDEGQQGRALVTRILYTESLLPLAPTREQIIRNERKETTRETVHALENCC